MNGRLKNIIIGRFNRREIIDFDFFGNPIDMHEMIPSYMMHDLYQALK